MSAAASPPSASPPWAELPSYLTANILQRLGAVEILQSAQYVCATWWKVCHNPTLWWVIKIVNCDDESEYDCKKFTKLCRRAVDRSQGQLISLTIADFGDNKLLNYIVYRSSKIQRLTLVNCSGITAFTLVEAVKNLHELEELHLILATILAGDIEAIGNTCPMLKSFTFNDCENLSSLNLQTMGFARLLSVDMNAQALAVAKTMPNLYHLGLLANRLDYEGLQAILDGCPHLESLDLRRCPRLDLGGPLRERCCQQIKHIKFPSDSIGDYEWSESLGDSFTYKITTNRPHSRLFRPR